MCHLYLQVSVLLKTMFHFCDGQSKNKTYEKKFARLSFQTAILLLRIDDIVSGSKRQAADGSGKPAPGGGDGPTEGPEP